MQTIKRTISADSALNHLGQLREFVNAIYQTRAENNIKFLKVSKIKNPHTQTFFSFFSRCSLR